MNSDYSSSSRWFRWREVIVTALVQWVPSSIGRTMRRIMYRTIFDQIGTDVRIDTGVRFKRAYGIQLGNQVTMEPGTYLRNIGTNGQIWIGDQVYLDHGVDIKAHQNGKIEIGDRAYIGPYACLSGKSINIGKSCLIASHTGIYASNHLFADATRTIKGQGLSYKGIAIEDDCWLGSGVKVLDGVTIGQGSVVGAGAVVTKSIPPYSIAVGVPAKVVSQRNVTPGNS